MMDGRVVFSSHLEESLHAVVRALVHRSLQVAEILQRLGCRAVEESLTTFASWLVERGHREWLPICPPHQRTQVV